MGLGAIGLNATPAPGTKCVGGMLGGAATPGATTLATGALAAAKSAGYLMVAVGVALALPRATGMLLGATGLLPGAKELMSGIRTTLGALLVGFAVEEPVFNAAGGAGLV